MGLKSVVRGRRVVTTNPDAMRSCPEDKVNRMFKADAMQRLYALAGRPVPAELARNEVFRSSVGRGGPLMLSSSVLALCADMLARLDTVRARQLDALPAA